MVSTRSAQAGCFRAIDNDNDTYKATLQPARVRPRDATPVLPRHPSRWGVNARHGSRMVPLDFPHVRCNLLARMAKPHHGFLINGQDEEDTTTPTHTHSHPLTHTIACRRKYNRMDGGGYRDVLWLLLGEAAPALGSHPLRNSSVDVTGMNTDPLKASPKPPCRLAHNERKP